MKSNFPIVVIGGGPAGSTVATLLAKRGYSVQLFEAETFPRDHIGESLLPATLELLEISGALKDVQAEGFVDKPGATMRWGASDGLWSWYFKETNKRFPTSYQVSRPRFDEILLNHARNSGVVVHENTRVDSVIFDNSRAVGAVADGHQIEAEFVVDASGQKTLIANQLKIKQWDEFFQNIAAYAYFEGGTHLEGEDSGNILVESVNSGWFWKIPLKNGVSSVGLVGDRDASVESIRGIGATTWFEQQCANSNYVSKMLKGAKRISEVSVTRDWSYFASKFAGSNHCLIGDAACFIDPLFSTGVHLAVYGGYLGAAYVATSFETPALADRAAGSFDRMYRHQYDHFHALAKLFYSGNRLVDSYFWQARQITGEEWLDSRPAFVRAVSGQSAQGYERSVLGRVELPEGFSRNVADIESERRKLDETSTNHSLMNMHLNLAESVEVTRDVVLNEGLFVEGWKIDGRGITDLPISEFVAVVLDQCKMSQTGEQIAQRMKRSGADGSVDALIERTLSILLRDGVLTT